MQEQAIHQVQVVDVLAHPTTTAVTVVLFYTNTDPCAVNLRFQAASSDRVSWTFARSLLRDGLLARAGEGDCRVGPHPTDRDRLLLTLCPPQASAVFAVCRQSLLDFVDATYELVSPDEEQCIVGRAMSAFIEECADEVDPHT